MELKNSKIKEVILEPRSGAMQELVKADAIVACMEFRCDITFTFNGHPYMVDYDDLIGQVERTIPVNEEK